LILAGVLTIFLGGLVFVAGALRGLWAWDFWARRPRAATAGQGAPPRPLGPIAEGRLVYQAHCVRCHGPEGRGGREYGATDRPLIRDLAAPSWRSPAAAETVRQLITQGIPARGMPGTGAALSGVELDRLVAYVLSLELGALARQAWFTPATGEIAPPISYRDASGSTGSLEAVRGKAALVAFWGTTCIPCIEELPEIEKLADRFRDTDLVILPICVDESDPENARDVAARVAPGLTVSVDALGSARRNYDVAKLPQAFLLDREGRIVARSMGARKWDRKEVDELFCAALGVPYPRQIAGKTAVSQAGP
jgi:mono/diheme cytochrome c family protein/peroxiredoxin